MQFSSYANRINSETQEMFELCKKIAKIAIGSYGLIYLHDDGDTNGNDNVFQVFSLAKGVWEKKKDPFLSPFIPKVEDEDKSLKK